MKLVLPKRATLVADRNPKGQVSFTYREYFPNDRALVIRTVEFARKLFREEGLPVVATYKGDWITVKSLGYVPPELFATMMESEFRCWYSDESREKLKDHLTEQYQELL